MAYFNIFGTLFLETADNICHLKRPFIKSAAFIVMPYDTEFHCFSKFLCLILDENRIFLCVNRIANPS